MDDSSLFLVRAGTRASAAGMGRFGAWAAEAWLSPTHSTPLNRLDKQKFFVVGIGLFSGVTTCLFPLTVIKTRQMASHDVSPGMSGALLFVCRRRRRRRRCVCGSGSGNAVNTHP